jgi:ZIP family zinc transporter
MENNILLAFTLTIIAGLTTTLGGFISFFIRKYNLKALAIGLGFSAGAMIYISLVELLKESHNVLEPVFGVGYTGLIVTLSFCIGIVISAIIDYFIPSHFEVKKFVEQKKKKIKTKRQHKLWRVGMFTSIVIAIHNFPEGLTMFSTSMINVSLGISVALAIAIHNIPEGISIALPIYYSTKSKVKAIFYSFIAGLTQPLGAIIGFFFIDYIFQEIAFGMIIAVTSGFMVYITFDQLLPTAREYGKNHLSVIGVILGMIIMALSLNLLEFAY